MWPLLLIVILKTCQPGRIRAALAWLGAALSAVAMALVYMPGADPSRVYYGTDTHASALFIGSALALSWPLRRLQALSHDSTRILDALGLAGIGVLAWAMGHFDGTDRVLYPAGLVVTALAAGAVVLAAASPGLVSWVLGWSPLRWIGRPVLRDLPVALAGHRADRRRVCSRGMRHLAMAGRGRTVDQSGRRVVAVDRAADHPRRLPGHSPGTGSGWSPGRWPGRTARPPGCSRVALVAALAVACAAGYGVLHARASSGLAAQISQGLKMSQQDRATSIRPARTGQAGQACRGPPARPGPPAPWRPRPRTAGAVPARVSGSAYWRSGTRSCSRRRPSCSGTARYLHRCEGQPPGQHRPVHRPAAGRQRRAAPGGGVRARHQRHVQRGPDAPAVTAIGPHRKLVLVNTYEARPWEAGINRVIAAAARGHAQRRAGQLVRDHPAPHQPAVFRRGASGAQRRAAVRALVKAAVRAAWRAGAPGQATAPGLPPTAHRSAPLG